MEAFAAYTAQTTMDGRGSSTRSSGSGQLTHARGRSAQCRREGFHQPRRDLLLSGVSEFVCRDLVAGRGVSFASADHAEVSAGPGRVSSRYLSQPWSTALVLVIHSWARGAARASRRLRSR